MVLAYITLLIAICGISSVQLIVKHRFNVAHGAMPTDGSLWRYLVNLLFDPWLWLAAAILVSAALLWYFALSRFPLSSAIGFAALVYPIVIFGSAVFLGEPVNLLQAIGCAMIMGGVWLIASQTA